MTHTNQPTNQPTQSSQNQQLEQKFLHSLNRSLKAAADKLRNNLDAANYKHIVLGLIFLKYISDSFTTQQAKLRQAFQDPKHDYYLPKDDLDDPSYQDLLNAELEVRDYYTADTVFWVPVSARWDNIKASTTLPKGADLPWGGRFGGVSALIDSAFDSIERDNDRLKGIIQRISGYNIDDNQLIGLVDLLSNNNFTRPMHDGKPIHLSAKDILGHVYEYFLGEFALEEGKKGGQYFTPKSIVSLIVHMLEPYTGRVYDPAMGSGGFFVQAERFISEHQGSRNNISIYGQESNPTTWKLAAMNMAIRGLEFDFGKTPADSFGQPQHPDLKADFVMANPPFNVKDWWQESLAGDPRWQYGIPPQGNANFAWLSHMIHHLSHRGKMAIVLANGSMSSQTNNEGEIRKAILKDDLVEAMIALPSQLFTNTQIPACIWVLNKAKARKGEVLFIDARQIGYMKDRTLRDFTNDDIASIANTYHHWQQSKNYQDVPAFCKSAPLAEIEKNDWVLTPGRYVGTAEQEDDGVPFAEKMQKLTACLNEQFKQSAELEAKIRANLGGLGYE
ncbi:type I restriction-modification system subunit M [Moraxella sp. ZJ142]|uniref:class I SAM-dependent DNA methyltransferase n=1 Tax=Moraxella marmotae TaxID=3344520 RepID=UPI0035D4DE68